MPSRRYKSLASMRRSPFFETRRSRPPRAQRTGAVSLEETARQTSLLGATQQTSPSHFMQKSIARRLRGDGAESRQSHHRLSPSQGAGTRIGSSQATFGTALGPHRLPGDSSAFRTFSGVIGTSSILTPTAS